MTRPAWKKRWQRRLDRLLLAVGLLVLAAIVAFSIWVIAAYGDVTSMPGPSGNSYPASAASPDWRNDAS